MFFGLAEGILRIAGFQYARTPGEMQRQVRDEYVAWQNRNIVVQRFMPHPRRMWTAAPGLGAVNEAGWQGPLLPVARTEAKRRILFLGDSCTNAGPDGYPDRTIARLAARGVDAEPIVAGVGGYSTFQGLDHFRELTRYAPDAVTAYFGWNDHWLALGGHPDDGFRPPSRLVTALQRGLGALRLYQGLNYLIHPPAAPRASLDALDLETYSGQLRVPLPRYRENVKAMAALAAEQGIPILFVAAPIGGHIDENRLEPMAETRHVKRLHAAYVAALRESVGSRAGASVLELADVVFDRTLMGDDGVHPKPAGNDVIAARLAEALRAALSKASARRG